MVEKLVIFTNQKKSNIFNLLSKWLIFQIFIRNFDKKKTNLLSDYYFIFSLLLKIAVVRWQRLWNVATFILLLPECFKGRKKGGAAVRMGGNTSMASHLAPLL